MRLDVCSSPKADIDRVIRAFRSAVGNLMIRMTIGIVFAAAFAISGAAQDFIAHFAFQRGYCTAGVLNENQLCFNVWRRSR